MSTNHNDESEFVEVVMTPKRRFNLRQVGGFALLIGFVLLLVGIVFFGTRSFSSTNASADTGRAVGYNANSATEPTRTLGFVSADDREDTETSANNRRMNLSRLQELAATAVPINPDEWFFEISGDVRDSIPMTEVDHARGGFSSPWPSLSHVLAEPGKLMVGPEFPQSQIDGSRGAIQRVNPGNQYRLDNNDYQDVGCQEGSLVSIFVQEAVLEFENGFTVSFRAPDGSGTHVYVRCPNADGQVGSDAGNNIRVSGNRPGYGLITHFSNTPTGGFISADGALQALNISQGDDSCGGEGCIRTYVLAIDMNTRAYTVAVWNGRTMETLDTNWFEN